ARRERERAERPGRGVADRAKERSRPSFAVLLERRREGLGSAARESRLEHGERAGDRVAPTPRAEDVDARLAGSPKRRSLRTDVDAGDEGLALWRRQAETPELRRAGRVPRDGDGVGRAADRERGPRRRERPHLIAVDVVTRLPVEKDSRRRC